MKTLALVALIASSLAAIGQTNKIQTTNAYPVASKGFWIDVVKNENGVCLVRELSGKQRVLTVYLANAPKTFFKVRGDFSRQEAYVRVQSERIRQWEKRIQFLDGQAATGAAGSPEYVAAQMAFRSQVNAEAARLDAAQSDLNAYKERLLEMKAADSEREPVHHPVRCLVEFVRVRDDKTPE